MASHTTDTGAKEFAMQALPEILQEGIKPVTLSESTSVKLLPMPTISRARSADHARRQPLPESQPATAAVPALGPHTVLTWEAGHVHVLCLYECRVNSWGNMYSATTPAMAFYSDGRASRSPTTSDLSFSVSSTGTLKLHWDWHTCTVLSSNDGGEEFREVRQIRNKRTGHVGEKIQMVLRRRLGPSLVDIARAGHMPWCS